MAAAVEPVATVDLAGLPGRLGLAAQGLPAASAKPLHEWKMEEDDAPILAWLYGRLRPRRHLEFGTWEGFGACLCLDHCNATVWSLNLWEGEAAENGDWRYYTSRPPGGVAPAGANTRITPKGNTAVQTDGGVAIGRLVRERGHGHRFCQVYCNSLHWDASNYPPDFFDTAFIDGGHAQDVVRGDTRKALSVLRPGGVVMWHDYCPDPAVVERCESVRGVLAAIERDGPMLRDELSDLFWVRPSWLLVGVKR